MKHLSVAVVIAILAAFGCSGGTSSTAAKKIKGDEVLLRLDVNKGDEFKYSMTSQLMGEDGKPVPEQSMEMNWTQKVTDVKNDKYTFEIRFGEMKMMGMQDPKTLDDMFKKLVVKLTMDPHGKVVDRSVENAPPGMEEGLGNLSNSVNYPKEAVKIGSTWQEQAEISPGSNVLYEYKLLAIKDGKADIEARIVKAEGMSTPEPGKMVVDIGSGMVESMSMNVNVGGMKVQTKLNLVK
jgi:hypothetical protein